MIYDLNREVQESCQRGETLKTSMETMMGELDERMNLIKDSNLNDTIPPDVIHSLNEMS